MIETNRCQYCNSDDIRLMDTEIFGQAAYIDYNCQTCQRDYVLNFTLTGVESSRDREAPKGGRDDDDSTSADAQ